jgi:hypothetical protein
VDQQQADSAQAACISRLAPASGSYARLLREAGRIDSASPMSVADLGYIPDGLNAPELEKYLRKHGETSVRNPP